jgi:flagellar basal-body rod protein FlgB
MFDLVSTNPMLQMMDRSMTLATRRMALIAGNLANIDTPNYRAQDFSFEDAFKASMAEMDRQNSPGPLTLPSHFPPSAPSPIQAEASSQGPAFERNDLNDVNLDQQTMLLAKTQNNYQLSSNFAQVELRRVLGAIRDVVAH